MTIIEVKPKLKFKRIMLATDFSPIAEVAQVYAVGMALEDSANLRLTTVLDLSKVVPYMEVIPESALDDLRHSAENALRHAAGRIDGVGVTTMVLEGFQAAALIIDEALDSGIDLIVLGTSSKHGLKKLALGSTAEQVIRAAPCPILTIGPHVLTPSQGPLHFERILYATDFSTPAAKALNLALALGQTGGARIHLCHVIADKEARQQPDRDARSMSSLEALVPEQTGNGSSPECIVEHGKSSDAILALAAKVEADLIVLGARKSSFWIEYVQPGLTPALLAEAKCPVLTVS
jgi:nucleotide-binding universal stress UspA family protein